MKQKKTACNSLRSESGFTLIELIMVLVIVGILASIAAKKMITAAQEAEITAEDTSIELLRSNLVNNYSAKLILNASEGLALAEYPDNPFDDLNQVPYGFDRRQNNKPIGNENTNDTWVFVQGASGSNPPLGPDGIVVPEVGTTVNSSTAPTGIIYHQRKDGTVVKWSYSSGTGIIGTKEFDRTSPLKQRQDRQKIERGEIIEGQEIRDLPGR
ncbi:MAG: type II secretion system protein [Nitrospinae bacterium]|nr:type II secretion system protein [Nitrospinota bacterium]